MIGAGGMARSWIRRFYADFTDQVDIVSLVDINEEALRCQGDYLGLPSESRFTNLKEAFACTQAD